MAGWLDGWVMAFRWLVAEYNVRHLKVVSVAGPASFEVKFSQLHWPRYEDSRERNTAEQVAAPPGWNHECYLRWQ